MISWVHTRAKSRLSWQNYVQEVVYKKVDVKNATPDVAETPPNQVRPSVWRVFWNVSVVRSNWTGLSERLPSIDEDVSSGAVVSGNPGKNSRLCKYNYLSIWTLIRSVKTHILLLNPFYIKYKRGLAYYNNSGWSQLGLWSDPTRFKTGVEDMRFVNRLNLKILQ